MANPIQNETLGRSRRERWSEKTFNRIMMEVVGPILIILMIGSLVFFLIEIFYRGPHAARLGWVLGLFTIAAVLVSRISIEGGAQRALLFGVPLAMATLVVTITLVDFDYGNLAILEPLVVAAFIGIVMWSANRLTWDCTMINESRDVSSIGLTELVRRKLFAKIKSGKDNRDVFRLKEGAGASSKNRLDKSPKIASRLFFLMFADKSNKNTPGLWVFYFSLAAFPIFGFGQWFAQPSEGWGYRWIFLLFAVYLASGLGLLMLTSLLGLERYLNKRGAELPTPVSQTWMLVGTLFAMGVMFLMLLLPSPSLSSGLENALAVFTTKNKSTSKRALGKDGQEQGADAQNKIVNENADGSNKRDAEGGEAKGRGKNGKSKGDQSGGKSSGNGKGSSKGQQSNQQNSKSGKSEKNNSNKNQTKSGSKSKSDTAKSDRSDGSDTKTNSPDRQSDDASEERDRELNQNRKQDQKNRAGQQKRNQAEQNDRGEGQGNRAQQQRNNPPPTETPSRSMSGGGKFLTTLMRFLVYGVGLIALLIVVWMFRDELAKLWSDLFGTQEDEVDAKQLVEKKNREKSLPTFTQFSEPFSNGMASKWPAAQTIQYTFQALEAWGRGFEKPRDDDQTPHEFAKRLREVNPAVASEAHVLADLHGQNLFSGGAMEISEATQLKKLWKLMTEHSPSGPQTRLVEEGSAS